MTGLGQKNCPTIVWMELEYTKFLPKNNDMHWESTQQLSKKKNGTGQKGTDSEQGWMVTQSNLGLIIQ